MSHRKAFAILTCLLAALYILALACCSCAGQLSDHVRFGDAASETAHNVSGDGRCQTLNYHVGAVDETTTYRESGSTVDSNYQVVVHKQAGQPLTLQIQEFYPTYGEDAKEVRYTYDVYIDNSNCPVYKRDYIGLMVGTTSYFVNVNTPSVVPASSVTVKFTNQRENAFRIAAMWVYSEFPGYCDTNNFQVPFYFCPVLYNDAQAGIEWEMSTFRNQLRPSGNIRLGVFKETRYFKSRGDIQNILRCVLRAAKTYNMPAHFALSSMWAGIPVGVPDGLGGKLDDHKYEQVCWSESDDHDEDNDAFNSGKQTLKSLLGAKWDLRYGWTTPNHWDCGPWLTLNSPTLNIARYQAIWDTLDSLKTEVDALDAGDYLMGISMENEPRYWDAFHLENGAPYPVVRKNLRADFNPVTVADAARSGVDLDPKDGLGWAELTWMHNNIAYFQQDTYNAYLPKLQILRIPFINSSTDSLWHEIYSQAEPLQSTPMGFHTAHHPSLEWNRVAGCRVGIEGDPLLLGHKYAFYTDVFKKENRPYAFYLERTREWGRFAEINFEATMAEPYDMRVWRTDYAFGARHFNTYNWADKRSGEWTAKVNRFFADGSRYKVNEAANQSASWVSVTTKSFMVSVSDDVHPIMNEIDLNLNTAGEYAMTVYDSTSQARILGYVRLDVTTAGPVAFHLPNCIPMDKWPCVYVEVARVDGVAFSMMTNPDGVPIWSAWMNPDRERLQSLVISWRADASDLIADLTSKKYGARLTTANNLFNIGDYRGAYEAAVKVETAILHAAPTGTIVVNGGAATTSSTSVTLTLSASGLGGVSRMRFSNDQRTWSAWEPYSTSRSWALSNWDGVGSRIVYVQYKDNVGIISPSFSDTINCYDVVWSDGFESNNFTTGGWTNSGCTISSAYKYSGTYAAEFDSTDSLTKAYSTSGKTSINVQYARYLRTVPTSGHFIAEYSTDGGTNWITMEDRTGVTSEAWTTKNWSLSSDADNKSGFQIRFKTTDYSSSQYAYLDDVKIIAL